MLAGNPAAIGPIPRVTPPIFPDPASAQRTNFWFATYAPKNRSARSGSRRLSILSVQRAMNETQLHYEADEITDSTSFSGVAVLGFLLSLAGLFAIGYLQMLPVAIVGSLLGAFVLLTASRFRLNAFSKVLGGLALAVGTTAASWGVFDRKLSTDYDVEFARNISMNYLTSLSADDLDKVYYLVGFQFEGVTPEDQGEKLTPIQRAKKRLADDASHVEIRSRTTPAKWEFVSVDGETAGSAGYTYRLRFRDSAQSIPPSYWVYARKDCGKHELREKVRWFVDNLERVKTP